ncbi:hypothetical protein HYQ09_gp116 [Acinetobacter phage vB_AbaM_Konradin]|uniref:Uncharacterized protein n=1 Tax=Acinetobacter phage vB_AbaM_Konradin TaxID=2666257 RepID=A0A650EV55_9CAUD|nr:hypothetical protein HYQ09_gp116 [Acinetobacter phage vB_AbaM_Konradin]QGT53880.1 hypothetical protein Konradin_117 [Acinetobacter phage vB_AbaM_Konradin]
MTTRAKFNELVTDAIVNVFTQAVKDYALSGESRTNKALPLHVKQAVKRNAMFALGTAFNTVTNDEIERILDRQVTHNSSLGKSSTKDVIKKILKSKWAYETLIKLRMKKFCFKCVLVAGKFNITGYGGDVVTAHEGDFDFANFMRHNLPAITSAMLRESHANNRSIYRLGNDEHRSSSGPFITGVRIDNNVIQVLSHANKNKGTECIVTVDPLYDYYNATSQASTLCDKLQKFLTQCENIEIFDDEKTMHEHTFGIRLRDPVPLVTVLSKSPLFMETTEPEEVRTNVAIEAIRSVIDALTKESEKTSEAIADFEAQIQSLITKKQDIVDKIDILEETIKILSK